MTGKTHLVHWSNDTGLFLSRELSWHHVFDLVMDEAGEATDIIISSFAITDKQVRKIVRRAGSEAAVTLILDFTIASRNARITDFASRNVTKLLLTNNHSKTIYAKGKTGEVLAVMSNNATNNRRYECGIIFRNHPVIQAYKHQFETMKADSPQWKR